MKYFLSYTVSISNVFTGRGTWASDFYKISGFHSIISSYRVRFQDDRKLWFILNWEFVLNIFHFKLGHELVFRYKWMFRYVEWQLFDRKDFVSVIFNQRSNIFFVIIVDFVFKDKYDVMFFLFYFTYGSREKLRLNLDSGQQSHRRLLYWTLWWLGTIVCRTFFCNSIVPNYATIYSLLLFQPISSTITLVCLSIHHPYHPFFAYFLLMYLIKDVKWNL